MKAATLKHVASLLAAWGTAALLLNACNINLDAPLLPNVGKHFPEGTNEVQASKDLTSLSKTQNDKQFVFPNLDCHR